MKQVSWAAGILAAAATTIDIDEPSARDVQDTRTYVTPDMPVDSRMPNWAVSVGVALRTAQGAAFCHVRTYIATHRGGKATGNRPNADTST